MLGATWVSYRDLQTTQKLQYWLVGFQVVVLVVFAVAALIAVANGNAFDPTPIELSWFNPFAVESFSAFAAGLSLSIFIFWGWDVTLTMNEETKGSEKTPGRAATITVVTIVVLYLLIAVALIAFAGVGTGEFGLGNPDIQDNVFFHLAGPDPRPARGARLARGAHELGVVAPVDVRRRRRARSSRWATTARCRRSSRR